MIGRMTRADAARLTPDDRIMGIEPTSAPQKDKTPSTDKPKDPNDREAF
jgi:hypothetical protein